MKYNEVTFDQEAGTSLLWNKAYLFLGMKAEYQEFIENNDIKEDASLWTIPMVKGLTCNKIVAAYKKAGVDIHAGDLDEDVAVNDRHSDNGSYLVSFKCNVEADQENNNQSADQRQEQGCKDITLLERLLLGLAYFLATGEHLDVKNATLCQGSRSFSGYVPSVHWRSHYRRIFVNWHYSDYRLDSLRARSVVSCQS